MTQHEHGAKHEHGHEHSPEHGHAHGGRKRKPLHHDWRLWVAVVLMLAAMAAYVLTDDERFQPGGKGQQMPAAGAPPVAAP